MEYIKCSIPECPKYFHPNDCITIGDENFCNSDHVELWRSASMMRWKKFGEKLPESGRLCIIWRGEESEVFVYTGNVGAHYENHLWCYLIKPKVDFEYDDN